MGNDIGYDSIVGGSHAATLHWIDNTGPITPGTLVLLDMGVGEPSLHRGRHPHAAGRRALHPLQRELYDIVHAGRSRPASTPSAWRPLPRAHNAAMEVLAHALADPACCRSGRGGARPRKPGLRLLTL